MVILGIDPGNEFTALAVWDGSTVLYKTKSLNDEVRNWLLTELDKYNPDAVAIEGIQAMGMMVGASVFDTCQWIGHFLDAMVATSPKIILKVKRNRIKIHHTGNTKANDSIIRKALIWRLGEPGTKKAPGVTYGVANDMWSALAIALWGHDVLTNGAPRQDKKKYPKKSKAKKTAPQDSTFDFAE